MKIKIIINSPQFSWKSRLAIFTSVFGLTWLFLEPLTFFVNSNNNISSYGILGYCFLLLFSSLVTFLSEYSVKIYQKRKVIFIPLSILLTEDGTQTKIEVPQDIKISAFIKLFLKYASKFTGPETFVSRYQLYDWELHVKRSDEFEKADNNSTIKEACIKSGDICKLYGTIKSEYKKGAACYITTATIKNNNYENVLYNLKKWRNLVLRHNKFGQFLESVYDKIGPLLASNLIDKEILSFLIRILLIKPAGWLLIKKNENKSLSIYIDFFLYLIFIIGLSFGIIIFLSLNVLSNIYNPLYKNRLTKIST